MWLAVITWLTEKNSMWKEMCVQTSNSKWQPHTHSPQRDWENLNIKTNRGENQRASHWNSSSVPNPQKHIPFKKINRCYFFKQIAHHILAFFHQISTFLLYKFQNLYKLNITCFMADSEGVWVYSWLNFMQISLWHQMSNKPMALATQSQNQWGLVFASFDAYEKRTFHKRKKN